MYVHMYITLGGGRAVKVSGFRNWVDLRDLDLEGYALCPGRFYGLRGIGRGVDWTCGVQAFSLGLSSSAIKP